MILLKPPLQVQPAGTARLNDRFGCIGAITPYQPGLRAVTGGGEIWVEGGGGGLGFVTGASTGAARVAFVGGEDIAGLSQASVLVYRVVGTVAGAVPAMAETTTGFWRFGFQANGTQFRTRDTSTGDTGGGEDLTMSAGTAGALEVRIGTYNAVAGRKRGYINGKLNASTTTSVNAFTTTKSAHIGVGTQDTAVNRSNTAPIFLVAFASREWSESEVAALSANPWQLFQPRKIWVPVSVAGGGGDINLTVAGSAQASTSSTGAITQAHALVGAGSSQAATSSAGAITQGQALTGSNASQAATSSTGAITQVYQLAGAGSAQAASSSTGAISLGVAINLAGAACAQASASSAAAITQAHQLAAAACTQAATSSAAAVSQVHALVAAACAQANASSTGAISLGEITAPVAPGARIWVPPDESRVLTGSSERRVWAAPAESRTLKAEP